MLEKYQKTSSTQKLLSRFQCREGKLRCRDIEWKKNFCLPRHCLVIQTVTFKHFMERNPLSDISTASTAVAFKGFD